MHVNCDGVVVTSKLGTHAGNQLYNSRMMEISVVWMELALIGGVAISLFRGHLTGLAPISTSHIHYNSYPPWSSRMGE